MSRAPSLLVVFAAPASMREAARRIADAAAGRIDGQRALSAGEVWVASPDLCRGLERLLDGEATADQLGVSLWQWTALAALLPPADHAAHREAAQQLRDQGRVPLLVLLPVARPGESARIVGVLTPLPAAAAADEARAPGGPR